MDAKVLAALITVAAELVRAAFRLLSIGGLSNEDARARLEAELARASKRSAKDLPEV